jgi:biopolymer transport protein ExbD
MKLKIIVVLAATIVVALTACKGVRTTEPEPLPFPNVMLPRNFKNADPSPPLDKSAVVLSLLDSSQIWVGPNEFSDLNAFDIIENRVNRAQQKLVYVRAVGTLDYVTVVNAINSARRAGALEFALQVYPGAIGPVGQFTIKVLPRLSDEDTLVEKKDPALIGVILSSDSKIELVKGGFEDGPVGPGGAKEDMGTFSDTSRLAQALTQTLADRTDRKVTIKAFLTTPYDRVVSIIDAVKGAGAHPIVLQIDDLPR